MQAQGEAFRFNWSWCCNDQLTCAQTRGRHISTDGEKHGSEAYVKAFWRDVKWLRAICYSHSLSSANRLHDGSQQCTGFVSCALFRHNFRPPYSPGIRPPTHIRTYTHAHKGKEFCSDPIRIMSTHADSSLWYTINLRSDSSRRESQ